MARKIGFIALLLTMMTGCATTRENGPQVGRSPAAKSVLVDNWTSSDLRVFAYYGGDVTMLGMVRAMNQSSLSLPRTIFGPIQFVAFLQGTPLDQPQHVSEQINMFDKETVSWRIRATGGSMVEYRLPN